MNKKKATLAVIFFTIFLDLVGNGILVPVVPQLFANPDSPYYLLLPGVPIKYGFILLGFLIASFPIAQFFAAPILGELSDIYGRKKVLAVSLFGTFFSYLLFAFGVVIHNIPLLFIARIIDGATGGNISVAQASIADISTNEDRAKNFGMIGAAYGLGFIIGPFLGGVLSNSGYISWFTMSTPFWFAAILSLMNAIFIIFFFTETHTVLSKKVIEWGKSLKHVYSAFTMKGLRVLFTTNYLYWSGFTFFATFFSVFLIDRFNFDQGDIGNYFAYAGIWIVLTQAVVARYISGKFSEVSILRWTLPLSAFFILLYYLPDSVMGLLLIVPFFAIANGLVMANLPALISRRASKDTQGEVLGINASVQALAQTAPPILSGFIAAMLAPETPVFIAGVLIVIAGLFFIAIVKNNDK